MSILKYSPLYISNIILSHILVLDNVAAYKSSARVLKDTRNGRFSYLYAIEEDLLHHNWEYQEKPCLNQLLKLIRNVHNSTLWAAWIWDSMQFPVGQLYGTRIHLGNYDQCMNFPGDQSEFRTQYCLAELKLSELNPDVTKVDLFGSVQNYIRHKTNHSLRYNSLFWGICAPSVCKPESISKLVDVMFKVTHLGRMDNQVDITVDSEYCQVPHVTTGTGFREYFVLSLTVFAIVTTLLCTIYVSFKGAETKSTDLAKAFDIKTNAQWLMKVEDRSLRSVMGVRMISTFIIVLSHQWIGKNIFGVSNARQIDKKLDDPSQCIRFNADLIVDGFFMLSGMLLTTNLLGKSSKNFNIFTAIVKRYIRLMTPVVLIIIILPIVLLCGEPGPLVKRYLQVEVDTCAESWWRTVLMIGNYGDTEKICYATLWSMASDFHLFVIGVLLYWVYRRNTRVAVKAYIVLAAASVLIPVIHGYIYHSPAVTTFDFRTSDSFRKHPISDPAYVRTHLRAGPYFVGVAFGYLMALYQPEKHRNIISKKLSVLAFLTALSVMLLLIYTSGIYHGRQYGPLEGAVFSVMRRNVFATLIGFLITLCEYGSLSYISSIMSWSGMAPLSKLSYGVYLTHFMLIMRFLSRIRGPLRSDAFDDIHATFGLLTVSSAMSFVIWLFWEAPIVNLFDIVLRRSNSKEQKNGTTNITENMEKTRFQPDDLKDVLKEREKKFK